MTRLLAPAAMALVVALIQLGVVPAFFDTPAAPLLPVALLAAWGTVRPAGEVWPVLAVAPVALGVASEQRVGMFMLALLPAAVIVVAAPPVAGPRRLARASVTAAAGAIGYLVVLCVGGGQVRALPHAGGQFFEAALMTALVAAAAVVALLPLRPRARLGLFE